VIEEAWNAYPYTKMKTTCPFVDKFYVDVETKYLPDGGSTVRCLFSSFYESLAIPKLMRGLGMSVKKCPN
jgi:hypothetical protein